MATGVRVKVRLDKNRINPMLYRHASMSARRAAIRTRDRARANLLMSGRYDTGRLFHSIDVRWAPPAKGPNSVTYNVGTPLRYGLYQEKGIGPVYPVRAKVLRFKPVGSNTFVFARRTRGFRGIHYLERAYKQLSLSDFLP